MPALRDRVVAALLGRAPEGSLAVAWPDGRRSRFGGDAPGPAADISFASWRAVRRLAFGGALGLAEAYLDGEWESSDLAALVEFGARARRRGGLARRPLLPRRLVDRIVHARRANTPAGARRNIAAHYDLGNGFYALWLDPTLTYSSAVFARPGQPLDEAQTEKCRRLLALLAPRPGQTLLEIGCGWGHFARVAAKEAGVRVTGITLSKEQHDFARRRVFEEGLAEKVRIELRDYRDVAETYDHVASVEMFEAVGEEYWPAFFGKLAGVLAPEGRAALQIITIDDALFPSYRVGVDFIQKYVFPGGVLPSVGALEAMTRGCGLAWRGAAGFGQHYARTLAEWRRRFLAAWPRIASLGFDERFRRLWTYYLAYCEGGFRAGNIDVKQIALSRA